MNQPPWVSSFRPQQLEAIQQILSAFQSKKKIVLLDAPTGSGKTLIGEMVRREMSARALYLCSSLALQSQFSRDFPTASILKGRSNYPTLDNPSTFPSITSADCIKARTTTPACINCDERSAPETSMHCKWCHPVSTCPYERAKASAVRNPLVCTNSYYFLYECNYIGSLTYNRQLIIVDEADTLETVILSFVTVQISSKQAREYGIEAPTKKTVESSWVEWAEAAAITLADNLKLPKSQGTTLSAVRHRIRTKRLLEDVRRLNDKQRGLSSGGWTYTGYDKGDISFKPIHIDHLAYDFLWRHCPRWLLMSATMISFQQIVDTLGINVPEIEKVAA